MVGAMSDDVASFTWFSPLLSYAKVPDLGEEAEAGGEV